ncbi:DUF169 domain-containing protein [Thermodesulfobacteriota bacterium]
MSKNKEYASRLKELEGYERKIVAFKICDEAPDYAEPYGDDVSFLCAIVAEVWEEGKKPFYITNQNILCGGAVYSGLGSKKLSKEDFTTGMEGTTIGQNCAYATREVFRRVNQQIPHHFKHHKYMVLGALEDMPDPDFIMIVADANRIMRIGKVYTWKTGELTPGMTGTAWCTLSFPLVYREKVMTFNMGDPPSRVLMNLDAGDMYCFMPYSMLPLIVDNFENISDGQVM